MSRRSALALFVAIVLALGGWTLVSLSDHSQPNTQSTLVAPTQPTVTTEAEPTTTTTASDNETETTSTTTNPRRGAHTTTTTQSTSGHLPLTCENESPDATGPSCSDAEDLGTLGIDNTYAWCLDHLRQIRDADGTMTNADSPCDYNWGKNPPSNGPSCWSAGFSLTADPSSEWHDRFYDDAARQAYHSACDGYGFFPEVG